MQHFILSCCSVLLLCQAVQGLHFGHILDEDQFNDNLDNLSRQLEPSTSNTSDDLLRHSNDSLEPYNSTSEYRSEQKGSESSLLSGSSPRTEPAILTSTNVSQLLSAEIFTTGFKAESATSITEIQKLETLTQISNESLSSTEISSTESSSIVNGNTQSSNKSTRIFVTPGSVTNQSDSDEEPEGVIIVKPLSTENGTTVTSLEKTLYQRMLEMFNDAYTLSIAVPVAAGIMFAITIIVTIATCRCLRRRCRRRRIRRNAKLPDSVKSLRPSDSARLLAESSDEEF